MTEIIKSYTTRQYPANALSDSGTYSDNNLTYTSTITNGTDISGSQYGGGNCIVKYSSYKTDTDNNLIVHYKFDDNSTNMLLDSTSNGNNLTNYNTTFDNTNYKIGNGSVYFNGNSQYIEMPSTINPYTIWNNNGISFSIWFNMSSTASPNCRIIDFSSDNIGTTPTNYILIYKDGTQTDKINIVIVAPNGANTYLSPTLNSNTWHHIVWTISSSGVWGLYINNVYINPGITQGIPNVTWTRRWLGRSSSDSDPYYTGNIDDFRIYNKVITESEVNTIYNNIISGIPKPWIIFKNDPAYYKKIDISSSEPNWNGNYDTVSPYSYIDVSTYLLNNFTGEYITIKLPQKIYLNKYILCSTIDKLNNAPQHFRIYGSLDGINWTQLVERQLTTSSYVNTLIPNSTYSTGYYTDQETKSTVAYDYYGIVVNKLLGPLDASNNKLSFSLWNIYGTNDLKGKSYFEFGVVRDTSKTVGSSLNDGLIRTNNSNIFIKSGNANTAALTIGSNNKIAIGKNIANEVLDISGSLIASEFRIINQSYPIIDSSSNIYVSGNVDISGNLTLNNDKFVINSSNGNLLIGGTLDVSKNININNNKTIIDSSGNIKSQGNFDLSNNINIIMLLSIHQVQ
jgi:hypothetical protein